jgi:hypothetical protein
MRTMMPLVLLVQTSHGDAFSTTSANLVRVSRHCATGMTERRMLRHRDERSNVSILLIIVIILLLLLLLGGFGYSRR